MNKNKTVFPLLIVASFLVLIVALSGCSSSSKSESKSSPKETQPSTNSIEGAGIYEDYSATALANVKSTDKVILFFHASWCPTCKSIEKDIKANLDSIPANVKILKVDYDSADDLKKQYGVRQQYTMVQVDNSGKKLGLWSDSYSLQDIVDSTV